MNSVGVRELKEKTSEIIRRVREDKEIIAITYRGREIAQIVPTQPPVAEYTESDRANDLKAWAEMEELTKQISARWPRGVSAEDAIREQRREL